MATTTNYSWTTPDNTAYVKDGASAIRTLGSSVDTTLYTALGGAYPGLRLVKKQTVGTGVTSVTVTNAFSATYENYKILYTGGISSGAAPISLSLNNATGNLYYESLVYAVTGSTTVQAATYNGTNTFTWSGNGNSNGNRLTVDLESPFLAKPTFYAANYTDVSAGGAAGRSQGLQNQSVSHTGFSIGPTAGTLTGGTIYVYGYGIS